MRTRGLHDVDQQNLAAVILRIVLLEIHVHQGETGSPAAGEIARPSELAAHARRQKKKRMDFKLAEAAA